MRLLNDSDTEQAARTIVHEYIEEGPPTLYVIEVLDEMHTDWTDEDLVAVMKHTQTILNNIDTNL